MLRETIKVGVANGVDVRLLAELVQVASYYPCSIYLEKAEKRVNAKSMMGMMSVGLFEGEKLTVAAEGEKEAEAVASICEFLKG